MEGKLLIRTVADNIKKGQATELVLAAGKGKEIVLQDIPHTITKREQEEISSDRLREKLQAFKDRITIEEKPYARTGRHAFQVSGNRDDLIEICNEHRAHFDTISVPQLLRWKTNFPYAILDENNKFVRKATLDELLSLPDSALDIETNKKITNEEDLDDPKLLYSEINSALYVEEVKPYEYVANVFTSLKTKESFVKEALDNLARQSRLPLHKLKSYVINTFENWEELIPKLAEHVRNSKVLTVHGHNVMAFDALELRDKPEEEDFLPAIDESEPKITAHAGFGRRVEVKGFWIFDHYGLSRFYLSFLPDKKAETVCNFFDVPYIKLIRDYRTLGYKIWKAQSGDEKEAAEVIAYGIGDAIASLELGKKLKRMGLILSRAFETSLESICAVSPKMLAKNFWDKRTFEQTNTFNFLQATPEFRNYDGMKAKLKALKLPKKFTRGIIDGREIYAIYFNPIPEVFSILQQYVPELLNSAETAKGAEKFVYLRAIDALGEIPMFDLRKTTAGRMNSRVFFAKYKMSHDEANRRLSKIVHDTVNFLYENKVEVLNYTDDLLLIEGKDLESKLPKWMPIIGKVKSLYSQDLGVYVANLDGKLIAQGIDIRARRGYAIEKEKSIITGFFETLLLEDNRAAALDLLYNELAEPLSNSTIKKEDLLVRIKPGKDAREYAEKSQDSFRVWAINKLGLQKGREYYIGFGLDKNKNPEAYLKEDFLKPDVKIDVPHYKSWLFGTAGKPSKLRTILETVCNPSRADDCNRLEHFMYGKASQAEIDILKQPVKPYVYREPGQAKLSKW